MSQSQEVRAVRVGAEQEFTVTIVKRDDGMIGPPLKTEINGIELRLFGYAEGVAAYCPV